MRKKCAVVLPLYKEFSRLDKYECISYHRLLDVLDDSRDIVLVTYKGLDLGPYLDCAKRCNKKIKVRYFTRHYFKSTMSYNKLLLNSLFYKVFLSYEYMLIYQLDAYIFKDNLDYWMSLNYDYIGAPWFDKYADHESGCELWEVGNGGFSLRKVEFYYRLLKYNRPLYLGVDINQGVLQFAKSLIRQFGFRNTMRWHKRKIRGILNEDCFLSYYLKKITNRQELIPHIPSPEEASIFAFEKSPSYLYKLNGQQLPMGCHAFMKYEYETFWSKFIH